MRYQRQLDESDCGPACLTMVASFYKLYYTIGEIRSLCKTDISGTNLAGLIHAANMLGFTSDAMRGAVAESSLDKNFIFPFIAHVSALAKSGRTLNHYVVVKKISKTKVTVWDPDVSKGKVKLSRSEFLKIWTGYVLFLTPSEAFTTTKGHRHSLLKFLPLVLPHKKELVIITVSSALLVVFGIIIANYYKFIMADVIIAKATFTLSAFSLGALLVILTQSVIESLRRVLINHFSFKAGLQLNLSSVTHLFKLPLFFFDSRKTGEILAKLNNNSIIFYTAFSLVVDCLFIIIISPVLFFVNRTLFAISVASVLFLSVIVFLFSKVFKKYYSVLQRQRAEVSSTLVEAIRHIETIKSLNAQKDVFRVYEKKQMQTVMTDWKTARLYVYQFFLSGFIYGLTTILIFWMSSSEIINETFSFGTLISFNSLLSYFSGPLSRIINVQPQLQEAIVSAERVSEILETEVEQPEKSHLLKPKKIEGNIEFRDVFFKYGMRALIYKGLSFQIHKGQWAAFVGPSGCGKSTLIKLLLKFYEPEQGAVFIDDHDLKHMDAEALRSRIGYVPQDIFIYAGTVAENISLGHAAATMEAIVEAAKRAGAHDFITLLPDQYDTKLSEHGSTLSGGEKQRLALARAFLFNCDMIILDEATSSLDNVSERDVHSTFESMRGSMTAIIIAHRLSTIKNCDIIFVMDKGAIVEYGNHESLLANNGLYKKMCEGG